MESRGDFDLWDDLLRYIHDGSVVPIVGADLLTVDTASGPVNLYRIVAERLADQLHVSKEGLSSDRPLDDVVTRSLTGGRERIHLYGKIKSILEALDTVPRPLQQLAEVRELNLFITTTFDSMLERAIAQARPGARIVRLDYAPNNIKDLPRDLDSGDVVIYHLFGIRASTPTFALTQEDLLEFVVAMMGKNNPERLFEKLCHQHLLFLGTGFTDWLARLVIRMAKGTRFSQSRDYGEFLVDPTAVGDNNLVTFLRLFSKPTELYRDGSAQQFVEELHRRYKQRNSAAEGKSTAFHAESIRHVLARPAPGSVFLSYAHEDFEAAQRIRDRLHAEGIDVWFDKKTLKGGDDWLLDIRSHIKKECALFIPIISRTTMGRLEGEFLREWNLAVDREETIADGVPFIIPTVIEDVPQTRDANVPACFLEKHWASLPSGRATDEYVCLIRDRLRDRNARRGARL